MSQFKLYVFQQKLRLTANMVLELGLFKFSLNCTVFLESQLFRAWHVIRAERSLHSQWILHPQKEDFPRELMHVCMVPMVCRIFRFSFFCFTRSVINRWVNIRYRRITPRNSIDWGQDEILWSPGRQCVDWSFVSISSVSVCSNLWVTWRDMLSLWPPGQTLPFFYKKGDWSPTTIQTWSHSKKARERMSLLAKSSQEDKLMIRNKEATQVLLRKTLTLQF